MRQAAAKTWPRYRVIGALAAFLSVLATVAHADNSAAQRRELAGQQFERAEKLRQELEARPEKDRTLSEYAALVTSYRRVYLITPRSTEVPPALNHVAALYRAMGDLFDAKYYQSAIDAYQFLLREYPTNSFREQALLAVARIEDEDLHDPVLAQKSYEEFLVLHPYSSHGAEVRALLDGLKQASDGAKSSPPGPAEPAPASAEKAPDQETGPTDASKPPSSKDASEVGAPAEVTRIRTWNADTYTRIVIDVGAQLKYRAARISRPDRIYFDIQDAKLGSALTHTPVAVEPGGFLKTVRVGQYKSDVVRVVLDVNHAKDYSVFLLPDPYRLVVDVYGDSAAAQEAAPDKPGPASATAIPPAKARRTAIEASVETTDIPPSKPIAPKKIDSRSTRPAQEQARAPEPPTVPEPTRDGQQSLTRVLGLKIGRIVIDPGHGGHDTGTIGPTGLMEKDLSLDVALRVGKLIRQHLPGAEVVYTRKDDSFVPLEERTAIANQARADLFVSVHANSSSDHKVRGVETYYLNFTGSSDAMEVAARENALSDHSVHELQDIVSKITQNDKIAESHDLASIIQDSLAKRIEKVDRGDRDRGVRKAPFVVLIGAKMPSVLAEISFISNPTDERWLKKPENRQRVAEGLYRGIESYLQSTNSLKSNQNPTDASNRNRILARSGNSQ
jgi:N-acetylmuramoyl-L-alanine amidase